jgi:hypothetical protein
MLKSIMVRIGPEPPGPLGWLVIPTIILIIVVAQFAAPNGCH